MSDAEGDRGDVAAEKPQSPRERSPSARNASRHAGAAQPLLRQAPVRRENLLHGLALQAVRERSAGLRQEAGQSLELGVDAVCDRSCAVISNFREVASEHGRRVRV